MSRKPDIIDEELMIKLWHSDKSCYTISQDLGCNMDMVWYRWAKLKKKGLLPTTPRKVANRKTRTDSPAIDDEVSMEKIYQKSKSASDMLLARLVKFHGTEKDRDNDPYEQQHSEIIIHVEDLRSART